MEFYVQFPLKFLRVDVKLYIISAVRLALLKKGLYSFFFLETIFLLIILIHLTVWSCRGGLLAGGMRVVEGGRVV